MCAERICDLNNIEKPREKLKRIGGKNLTDVDLLAIVLRSGGKDNSVIKLSRSLLNKYDGLHGLMNVEIEELSTIKDIGFAKASCIKAVFELSNRIGTPLQKETVHINKPKDVYTYLKQEFAHQEKESLYLLSLNVRGKILSKDLLTVGTANESLISPRDIFRKALARNAVSIVLAHNHPSGDPTPSLEDIQITQRIIKAGEELGIKLLDHVVITNTNFVSIKGVIN